MDTDWNSYPMDYLRVKPTFERTVRFLVTKKVNNTQALTFFYGLIRHTQDLLSRALIGAKIITDFIDGFWKI